MVAQRVVLDGAGAVVGQSRPLVVGNSISRGDLSTMFHSSSMLDDDATTAEVVSTFVNKVFKTFNADQTGKISFDDVMRYMQNEGKGQDVWTFFGRSLLVDFSDRHPQRNNTG